MPGAPVSALALAFVTATPAVLLLLAVTLAATSLAAASLAASVATTATETSATSVGAASPASSQGCHLGLILR